MVKPAWLKKSKLFKKTKSIAKKNKLIRRRPRRGKLNTLSRSVVAMSNCRPDKLLVKLPYETTISMTGAFIVDHEMNTNSLFDPDRTGSGHQPLAYDQWTPFYNRYLVYGVSYDIDFVQLGNAVNYVGIVFNNDTTSLAITNALEQPRGMNKFLTPSGGSASKQSFRGYVSNAVITGVRKSKYNSDDTYSALTSGNPSETIIAHIFSLDSTAATNVNIMCRVRFVYHACFYDPVPLAQS